MSRSLSGGHMSGALRVGAPSAEASPELSRREDVGCRTVHSLVPDSPRVYWPQLVHWSLSHVTLRREVRLIDLRDPALAALGLHRRQLMTTDAAHEPCTRLWAERLLGRHIGGKPTFEPLWHS